MSRAMRLALCFVAVAVAATAAQQAPAPPSLATVMGTVVDGVTGQPVSDTIVELRPMGGPVGPGARPQTRSSLTSGDGRFTFRDVIPSNYQLIAMRFRARGAYGQLSPTGSPATMAIAADGRSSNLIVRMWSPATISGTVYDERGRPMSDVRVRAISSSAGSSSSPGGELGGASASTDDRGQYSIAVSAGRYVVVLPVSHNTSDARVPLDGLPSPIEIVRAHDYVERSVVDPDGHSTLALSGRPMPPPPDSDGRPRTYVTTFAPDTTMRGSARVITVASGRDEGNVDVRVQAARSVRVAGHVIGPMSGERVPGTVVVQLVDRNQPNAGELTAILTRTRDGAFVLMDVPKGEYTLKATRTFISGDVIMTDAEGMFATSTLSVGDRDISDLAVTLRAGITVRGHIEFDETPPPGVRTSVTLENLASQFERGGSPTRTPPPGQFELTGVRPGRYVVRASSPVAGTSGWLLKSAELNGRDVADEPLDLQNDDVGDIVVTLTRRLAQIAGTVRDAKGPAPEAAILLFSTARETWANLVRTPRRVRAVRPALDGHYAIENLPAGEYFIAAIDGARADDWRSPTFLESLAIKADRVVLADGQALAIDLRIAGR